MSQELQVTSESPAPREAARARILLAVLTAVAMYLCWRTLQPFATVLLWAMVLALMFRPLFRQLLARTRRRNLAAALTVTVAVVSVLLPVVALSVAVAAEVGNARRRGAREMERVGWRSGAAGARGEMARRSRANAFPSWSGSTPSASGRVSWRSASRW